MWVVRHVWRTSDIGKDTHLIYFEIVHLYLYRVVLLSIWNVLSDLICINLDFYSAPLSLGHFVKLIIQLKILKYFANCSLDPLFVFSGHGNGYWLFQPFHMAMLITPAIFMATVFVPTISYGDGFCLCAFII